MLTAFEVHKLNEGGIQKAKDLAEEFQRLYDVIVSYSVSKEEGPSVNGRELALVRTKLEEACFYAKKSMAMLKDNQV